jgi:hypothetical protein
MINSYFRSFCIERGHLSVLFQHKLYIYFQNKLKMNLSRYCLTAAFVFCTFFVFSQKEARPNEGFFVDNLISKMTLEEN